jgi:hypothetical protein
MGDNYLDARRYPLMRGQNSRQPEQAGHPGGVSLCHHGTARTENPAWHAVDFDFRDDP